VEPSGVKEGLRKLAAGGTPSRMLILDDGWQSTDNDADYRRAPAPARGRCVLAAVAVHVQCCSRMQ
jgi:hypothetical protein